MALDPETKQMVNALQEPGLKALIVGDEIIFPPLHVGEKAFHFNHVQVGFLYGIQKYNGDIAKAAQGVNQTFEWAQKFIASRKFKSFRNAKLAAMSVRNGDLVEWWWKYGLDGAKGYAEHYEGVCHLCHEKNVFDVSEIEMSRQDDMTLAVNCKICFQPVEVEHKKEPLGRSREQVQFWSELGNRLSPKIERVHHEFSTEKFSFVEDPA